MFNRSLLSAAIATSSLYTLSLAIAPSASAISLRDSRPDLFNSFQALVNQERLALDEMALPELDPTTLQWKDGADSVDVFFLNEGAGHRNQLLFSNNGGELQTIFDDIASQESILAETQADIDRRIARVAQLEAALGLSALTLDLSDAEIATVEAELNDKISSIRDNIDTLNADLEYIDYTALKWNEKRDLSKNLDDNLLALEALRADAAADPVEVATLEEKVALGALQKSLDDHNSLRWRRNDLLQEVALGDNGLGAMELGDGKSLGSFGSGTQLDFFIRANGARNANGRIYGADASQNADGLQHVIAYEYFDDVEGENYVIIGFEDLFGAHYDDGGNSDRDFNDVVFAVRGVTGTRVSTAQAPEPTSILGLIGVAGALGLRRRRR